MGGSRLSKTQKENTPKARQIIQQIMCHIGKQEKKGREKKGLVQNGCNAHRRREKEMERNIQQATEKLDGKTKRDRKLLRDRISARHSRQKKKEYISSLEDQVTSLEKEKSLVDKRMMDLEEENKSFHEEIKKLRELAFSENILTAPLLSQLTISGVSEKKNK